MSTRIHPTAIVDPKAELGEDVEIGPNAIIEAGVTIGARSKIGPMVHIQGTTVMGEDNQIFTGATIGFPPQFLGFSGAPTRLIIGSRNVFREYVSIHRGLNDESETTIGDDNFLMGSSHVAHDCHLGNRVIMANGALLAGHVSVGDRTFISGNAVVHQFVRIGRLVMVSGLARVGMDVPPFTILEGHHARLRGLNTVGLRRAEIGAKTRMELKRLLFEIYKGEELPSKMVASMSLEGRSPEAIEFIEFYKGSKRGVTPLCLNRGEDENND